MNAKSLLGVVCALSITCAMTVSAITVLNPSFEETSTTNGQAWISPPIVSTGTNLYGWDWWTQQNGIRTGICNSNNATWCPGLPADDGGHFGQLWVNNCEIAQTMGGFSSGVTYYVEWAAAARGITPGGQLWVLMDALTIAQYNISNQVFTTTNIQFTATKSNHRLRFFHAGEWDRMLFVDDVKIIPEPAAFALAALLGLFLARRAR